MPPHEHGAGACHRRPAGMTPGRIPPIYTPARRSPRDRTAGSPPRRNAVTLSATPEAPRRRRGRAGQSPRGRLRTVTPAGPRHAASSPSLVVIGLASASRSAPGPRSCRSSSGAVIAYAVLPDRQPARPVHAPVPGSGPRGAGRRRHPRGGARPRGPAAAQRPAVVARAPADAGDEVARAVASLADASSARSPSRLRTIVLDVVTEASTNLQGVLQGIVDGRGRRRHQPDPGHLRTPRASCSACS